MSNPTSSLLSDELAVLLWLELRQQVNRPKGSAEQQLYEVLTKRFALQATISANLPGNVLKKETSP